MARPPDGYPDSWGSKRASIAVVAGPDEYAEFSGAGIGGQVIPILPTTGVKLADFAVGGPSASGTYRVVVAGLEPAVVNGVTIPNAQIRVIWLVNATGAQVTDSTDLSDETVSVLVIGPK